MCKVWWDILNICVANFKSFLAINSFKNRLRFDKVTERLKVGTFLRHSVLVSLYCLRDFFPRARIFWPVLPLSRFVKLLFHPIVHPRLCL